MIAESFCQNMEKNVLGSCGRIPFINSTGVQPSPKHSADWADTLQTLKYCSLHVTEHCLTISGLIFGHEATPDQHHTLGMAQESSWNC